MISGEDSGNQEASFGVFMGGKAVDSLLSRFSKGAGLRRPVQSLNSQQMEEDLDNSQATDAAKENKRIRHILSVDVEDYFQVEAFANEVPRRAWGDWPSRVVENTHKILNLFERHGVQGTFFFLGWVANRFPDLVRDVQAQGHELACHSYWHRRVYSLSPSEFREDVRISKDAIEQAAGVPVYGYRAPSWSINKDSLWALDILAEEGFRYDSSIYPIRHDLYGIPNAPRFACVYQCRNGGELTEIPPPTVRIAGFNLPGAGGGYLRIFPFLYTEWVFRTFEQHYRKPVVTYFHPWEIDPDQPRIPAGLKSSFRHYTNIGVVEARLSLLLQKYLFQPIATALAGGKLSRAEMKSAVSERLENKPNSDRDSLSMISAKNCSHAARAVFPMAQGERTKG